MCKTEHIVNSPYCLRIERLNEDMTKSWEQWCYEHGSGDGQKTLSNKPPLWYVNTPIALQQNSKEIPFICKISVLKLFYEVSFTGVCQKLRNISGITVFTDALTELRLMLAKGLNCNRCDLKNASKAKQFSIGSSIPSLAEVTCLDKTYFANNIGNSDP